MQGYVQEQETTPIGTIISFMGTKAPKGYLICDGAEYNIADYPEFVEYLQEQFNNIQYFGWTANSTFKVPDLRGEFLRGTGTNSHTNQGSGAAVGKHQDATEYPYILPHNTLQYISKSDTYNADASIGSAVMHESYQSRNTGTSQPQRKSARPTNTAVLYCIKAEHIVKETA